MPTLLVVVVLGVAACVGEADRRVGGSGFSTPGAAELTSTSTGTADASLVPSAPSTATTVDASAANNPCPEGWLGSGADLSEACLDSLMVTVELYPEFRAAGEDPMDFYAENEAGPVWTTSEYPLVAPVTVLAEGASSGSFGFRALLTPSAATGAGAQTPTDGGTPMDGGAGSLLGFGGALTPLSLDASVTNFDAGGTYTCTNEMFSVAGEVSFDVPFKGTYGPVYVTDFGGPFGRRHHWVYASADFDGNAHLRLGGSISGSARGWTASISGSGNGRVTARILVWQKFQRGRQLSTHTVATATIVGDFVFADSVSISQECPSTSGPRVTSGTPTLRMDVSVPSFQFYGLLFPNLNGPIITRVRSAISRFIHGQMQPIVQNYVNAAFFRGTARYQTAKMTLLSNLQTSIRAKVPAGCGCGVSAVVFSSLFPNTESR